MEEKIMLEGTVFPSEEKTIEVMSLDEYGGAHEYKITNCRGFNKGKTEYTGTQQTIKFIKKLEDGTIQKGLQSEQLVIMLLDRHKKLNDKFPSEQYEKMKTGLEMFLEASKERVEDRMKRNVMGNLKK
jgi:hypothetical protein